MIDSTENHAPTPEFTEFLARDIVRTLRHESRFASTTRRAATTWCSSPWRRTAT